MKVPRHQNEEYDFTKAFQAIEDELMASMIRNMSRHRAEETKEGIEWSQWQAEQLKALEKYKRDNQKKYTKQFKSINNQIEALIRQAKKEGSMSQEIAILKAIKGGFKGFKKISATMSGQFFALNERKLEALVKATTDDMKKAEMAVLRMANDRYRKVIFNAQVYANTGAATYEKAVDMATKDFLAAGLNCVEYKNGARHTLSDYADMAIRTASKRAYLQGEGVKRQEWGISTVIMNKRGNPCPKCLPFVGKVLIDDVWSGGTKKDGKYPLMSAAICAGLYHPRCKDSHTTYFPGISTADDTWTKEELEAVEKAAKKDAEQQYVKRQMERNRRLAKYSLDKENKRQYQEKADSIEKSLEKISFTDVTDDWKKNATPNSHNIVDLQEYAVENVTYRVDGKHVILDYAENERHIAELLEKHLGGEIGMVPRVMYPKNISTPDYIFRGERYDLKSPTGSSDSVLYSLVKRKKKQASNFIFDISSCPLDKSDILAQAQKLFLNNHTDFINRVIIIKGDNIIAIYERNKK